MPNISDVNGFLSLGDGGIVTLYFDPAVAVANGLKLQLGEVNPAPGESVTVHVAETPLPASFWLCLSSLLCLFVVVRQNQNLSKSPV